MVKRPRNKEHNKIISEDRSRFYSDGRHVKLLKQVMKDAVTDALSVSRALDIPNTYMEHGKIIKTYPDGKQELIAIKTGVTSSSRETKLKKGAVINVRQQ